MTRPIIALIGNPNAGKTSLFNQLTGLKRRVANWPGVTVEKAFGTVARGGFTGQVVDLPGIYSLSPAEASEDERIARLYLAAHEADVVVDIVDATNLERHLYLTVQLLELGHPVVVALNMMDVARQSGVKIDIEGLASRLGCSVVPIAAARGEGIGALVAAIAARVGASDPVPALAIDHGDAVEAALADLAGCTTATGPDARLAALALAEGDPAALGGLDPSARQAVETRLFALRDDAGARADLLVADGRFQFVMETATAVVRRTAKVSRRVSDRIDRVVLHPWLGLPIFFGLMYLMFVWTISVGGAFIDFFDIAAGTLFVDGVAVLLGQLGAPAWLSVIVADGIGGGIQTVATFVPIIGCLFLFLALLEDSGYMARAAFVMERLMRAIGLPGRAFLPLLIGFGCNVPAIMATRILGDPKDRKATIMMIPFMSCGARVPVYALFAAAFFPAQGQNLVFVLYLLGILTAIATGYIMRRTLLAGTQSESGVIELPRYHWPTTRNVLVRTWDRLRLFVVGAGKIIVVMVMVLSVLSAVSRDGRFGDVETDESLLADIGRAITPVFAPMGIAQDNWPASVGIFTGLLAKEAVVGTLDNLYRSLAADEEAATGGGDAAADEPAGYSLTTGLAEAFRTIPENLGDLAGGFIDPLGIGIGNISDIEVAAEAQEVSTGTFGAMVARFDGRLGAFAFLLFTLLYFPCFAAMGAVYRELGMGWTLFTGAWTTGLAYVAATIVYQLGRLATSPGPAALLIAAMLLAMAVAVIAMARVGALHARTSGAGAE